MQHVNALLAGEGTRFDQAIDSFPLCCPSRATNLTGQYAHNHGVLHNSPPFGGFVQLDSSNTLPVWLANAGYRTMHVGRYLNGYEARHGTPPGWTDWVGLPHSNAFNYVTWKAFDRGVLRNYPDAQHPGEYLTDFETRRGVELIDQASPGDRPFYLSLWYTAPHRGGPTDADDPTPAGHALARTATQGCLRRHADAAPPELQREEHVRQAAGGGRPPAPVARVRGRDRGELAPGDRVADGGRRGRGPDRRGAAPQRRAREHADRLHVRQRVHARRAPRAGREGAALRGVDPGADGDARPGRAAYAAWIAGSWATWT